MNSDSTFTRTPEERADLEERIRHMFEQRLRFNQVVGFRVDSLDPASPRLVFDMRPELIGNDHHKRLHGGVIAAALDTIAGLAVTVAMAQKFGQESVDQLMERFSRVGTIDLRVDYLRQGIGRSFYAGAKVVRLGGRIGSVQMELKNDADLLIATGAASYVVS